MKIASFCSITQHEDLFYGNYIKVFVVVDMLIFGKLLDFLTVHC